MVARVIIECKISENMNYPPRLQYVVDGVYLTLSRLTI